MDTEEESELEFPSLQDHCLYYLVTHLNDYPIEDTLDRLPRHLRRALLLNVAPVHLAWLDKTTVARGIDTDSIWERFLQHREEGVHKAWLRQIKRAAGSESEEPAGATARDAFISFVYSKLFVTNQWHAYSSQSCDLYRYPISVFLYGLAEPLVEEGVLRVAQNSPLSLIGNIDLLTCCVANYSPALDKFESVYPTLSKYGIFPRVLNASISSRDNLIAIGSSSARSHQLERMFCDCSPTTKELQVTLNDRIQGDIVTVTRIISGLASSSDSPLSTVDLGRVAEATLSSIAPILADPLLFLKIKFLSLHLFHGSEEFIPPLIKILKHQTSLQFLSLSFERTTCGSLGLDLVSSLSHVFTYPKFKKMELKQLIDFPVVGVISAFLCSSSTVHQQTLRLVHQRLAIPKGHPDLNFELPSAEHSRRYGLQKCLLFENVTASRSFYDWLFSVPCLCFSLLRFSHCKAIDDGGSKLNLNVKYRTHPNASVSTFTCKRFHYVSW